jgi:cytochrome c-type biogenesis protein
MNGRLALGFTAGMLASVNPCGFAMLPAYLGWFISGDGANEERGPLAAVLRGILVALAVSAGFAAVFGLVGGVIAWVLDGHSTNVYRSVPWLTVVVGLLLAIAGVAMLFGWQPTFALPKLDKLGHGRGLGAMFLFGVSYAVASVSCTLPVFISQVFNAAGGSFADGIAVFAAYTLGMAAVLTALTVTLALARRSFATALRHGMRYVNRAAGALLVVTGAYVAWYGSYEIRGNLGADPAVDRVTGWSEDVSNWIQNRGAATLGLAFATIVAVALLASYLLAGRRRSPG